MGVTAAEVTRLPAGDRHSVYKVSGDLVVRLSTSADATECEQVAHEARVLERLHGMGAPLLYDSRCESPWFDVPVMCQQFVAGDHRGLSSPDDASRLGAVLRQVHGLPVDGLFSDTVDPRSYVDQYLELIRAHLPSITAPASLQPRIDRALFVVTDTREQGRGDRLVLLHGDVGPGNIIWTPEPVLLDWEYARLGDPADEVGYIFGQHGFSPSQRAAFWQGYGIPDSRVAWWEPATLLGSALWWLVRWSRRAAADAVDIADTTVPRPQSYYMDNAVLRLDRCVRILDDADR